ncbi:unnamed protein product [Rotaria socialis]|uniref:TLDc domain-containing protein n=1 Tax=Rotaria socialis TaxID=392032 RepID=A0A817LB63_9BILA|nr:unnamed protein product [Rotaria socialis]
MQIQDTKTNAIAKDVVSTFTAAKSSKLARCTVWVNLIVAVVPSIVFGVFTVVFTLQQNAFAAVAHEQEQHQASEQRIQSIFDNCVDVISEILLSPNFNRSDINHLQPIQVKVITALQRLDPPHKRDVIFYLHVNKLIRNDFPPEFRLDLRGADLNGVEFATSRKTRCVLNDVYLPRILASNIIFSGCELDRSNFEDSVMDQSQFYNCSLGFSKFLNVNLEKAIFQRNMYWKTDFSGSSLAQTSFTNSSWLYFVNFTNVDLLGSDITENNLLGQQSGSTTNIVFNSRLPNGSLTLHSTQVVQDGGAEEECMRAPDSPTPWKMHITRELILTHRYVDNSSLYPVPVEGNCYFLAKKISMLGQGIDVRNLSRLIDLGQVACNVSVYFGCSQSTPSNQIVLSFGFIDANGWPLVTAPYVLTTTEKPFRFQSITTSLLIGTRFINVHMQVVVHNQSTSESPQYCVIDKIRVVVFHKEASRDGFDAKTFHSLCDNQGPTMTIIQSKANYLFGDYTSISWTSDSSHRNDYKEFLFTLINLHKIEPTKYPIDRRQRGCAVYHHRDDGPIFGGFGYSPRFRSHNYI